MSDRELLEWAAKAAGIAVYESTDGTLQNRPVLVYAAGGAMGTMPYEERWNPLADDSQALRLAVRLNLIIECMVGQSAARTFDNKHAGCVDHADAQQYPKRDFNPNPYTATRRAIVRAAASIGQQMEK